MLVPVPRSEEPHQQLGGYDLGEAYRELLKIELGKARGEIARGILSGIPDTYAAYREEVGKHQALEDMIDGLDEVWEGLVRRELDE